ncbi:hypothetical protein FO519_007851 [Halicephalobus sp. NKZ332]|nr:hypothetical protein FO519_007851 [Halicephalobus sp. NKZ332]
MPFVTFVTNLPEHKLGPNFNLKLNKILSEAIPEKSSQHFGIHVISTKNFTFGTSEEPAAMLTIKAFGIYTSESCKRYSKAIGEALQEAIELTPSRLLIDFADTQADHVGFNLDTC